MALAVIREQARHERVCTGTRPGESAGAGVRLKRLTETISVSKSGRFPMTATIQQPGGRASHDICASHVTPSIQIAALAANYKPKKGIYALH